MFSFEILIVWVVSLSLPLPAEFFSFSFLSSCLPAPRAFPFSRPHSWPARSLPRRHSLSSSCSSNGIHLIHLICGIYCSWYSRGLWCDKYKFYPPNTRISETGSPIKRNLPRRQYGCHAQAPLVGTEEVSAKSDQSLYTSSALSTSINLSPSCPAPFPIQPQSQ